MSEQFSAKASQADTAAFIENMSTAEGVLSDEHKDLASLHPVVQELVETDTSSEDFGRIKNMSLAEDMATRRNRLHDQVAPYIEKARALGTLRDEDLQRINELDDIEAESEGEYSIRHAVPIGDGARSAEKAVKDFRITQGNQSAMDARTMEISYKMETPTRGTHTNVGRAILNALRFRRSGDDKH